LHLLAIQRETLLLLGVELLLALSCQPLFLLRLTYTFAVRGRALLLGPLLFLLRGLLLLLGPLLLLLRGLLLLLGALLLLLRGLLLLLALASLSPLAGLLLLLLATALYLLTSFGGWLLSLLFFLLVLFLILLFVLLVLLLRMCLAWNTNSEQHYRAYRYDQHSPQGIRKRSLAWSRVSEWFV
jgi:hypothetical protein